MYDPETPFIYVFVRRDLPLVQQIIQTGHVCYEAGIGYGVQVAREPHMSLHDAESEKELILISRSLRGRGIDFAMFHEPDGNIGYTAICTKPLRGLQREQMTAFVKYE